MLNITNYQGNTNQDHNEIIIVGEDVEKREVLCPVGGNVNWCSRYGKRYGGSSKN